MTLRLRYLYLRESILCLGQLLSRKGVIYAFGG